MSDPSDAPLPSHVQRVELEGKTLTLIGTAHVSQASVAEVRRSITELRPDAVCVELDEARFRALTDDDYWRTLDVFEVIRQGRVGPVLASTSLASIQRRIGNKLGVRPGAEQLAAVAAAREVGAEVVLADRDIQVTFRRTWRNLSLGNRARIALMLALTPFSNVEDEIDAARVERLKEEGAMSDMLTELAKAMPQVKAPLIDERDRYLIATMRETPGAHVVAVVGAAHVSGMLALVHEPIDRAALLALPVPSPVAKLLRWVPPLLVAAGLGLALSRGSWVTLQTAMVVWAATTTTVTTLFTLAALAHPLAILAAAALAPIAPVMPGLRLGAIAGRIHATWRRPGPDDGARALDDFGTVRGIYRNRFTQVLLVVTLASIGAAVGTGLGVLGLAWVLLL